MRLYTTPTTTATKSRGDRGQRLERPRRTPLQHHQQQLQHHLEPRVNWAKNAKHMHDLAVNNGDVNYQAIGLTLKVYYLQLVTDVFGGIPYQEALQGDSGLLKPRVETQKEVYEGMIADLERSQLALQHIGRTAQKGEGRNVPGRHPEMEEVHQLAAAARPDAGERTSDEFSPTIAQRIRTVVSDPAAYPRCSRRTMTTRWSNTPARTPTTATSSTPTPTARKTASRATIT